MSTSRHSGRWLLAPAMALAFHPLSSRARTWNVYADGSGDAPTIQAAVDSTSPGDTILVHPGTYTEQVDLTTELSLIGAQGPSVTTLDAGGVGFCVQAENVQNVLIQGLRLEGAESSGYGYDGYAIQTSGDAAVQECVIANADGGIDATQSLSLSDCELLDGTISIDHGMSVAVQDCLFDGTNLFFLYDGGYDTDASVVNCVFRGFGSVGIGWGWYLGADLNLVVEDNLFVGGAGPAVGKAPIGPTGGSRDTGENIILTIRGNTIARSEHYSLGTPEPPLPPGTTIERNVITNAPYGLVLPSGGSGFTVACNNVWGNEQNWVGVDFTGIDGNISEYPRFCNPSINDFTVGSNSPCLPANNSCGVLMGAFGVGCAPIAIQTTTWGDIKAKYRAR